MKYRNQILCAVLTCCVSFVNAGQTPTEKRGVIDHDEKWDIEGSPYLITDDILVTKDARLLIAQGVTVLVGKPHSYDPHIPQIDHLDSFTVSIHVQGILNCSGRRDNRVTIKGKATDSAECDWYGIVMDGAIDPYSEIAFTDIEGACNGLTVRKCAPLVRNTVFEFNNVGLTCTDGGRPRVYNCVIAHNFTSGVRVEKANPVFYNNLVVFNRNNGIWSDGISNITFENNCVFGNADGNLVGCNPELGVFTKAQKGKDSTDFADNFYTNPVFAATPAESLATERDVSRPTDKSRIRDATLAKVLNDTLADSSPQRNWRSRAKRYELSPYSPCIHTGKKGRQFLNADGSRNDMGIYGGPEFFEAE